MPPASKPKSRAKPGVARKRAAPAALNNALAEAAWSDADLALAEALAEFDRAEAAVGGGDRGDAMALLGQALSRAARKRGLTRIGALGAREPYDPKLHELAKKPARAPKTVRIEARGVKRGAEVLAKARVVTRARSKQR